MKTQHDHFDRLLQIRAPEVLAKALDRAAGDQMTSRSDYIRRSLIDRLRADGFDPAAFAA